MSRRPISKWPRAERPREKLLLDGPHLITPWEAVPPIRALSDAELLAIILRLGTKGSSAIDLGREVHSHFRGFRNMADADMSEWRKIKGLGMAKTASLIAAVEIARRFWAEPSIPSAPITSASHVVELLGPHLRDLKHEVFEILLLNGKRKSIGSVRLHEGTVNETFTYAREIISSALQKQAASFVLIHNHPSGDPTPSDADVSLTRQIVFAGRIMKVRIQDHVIIGDGNHFSFNEQDLIRRFEDEWERVAS